MKNILMIVGLLLSATTAAQMGPHVAEFMQAMDASMKRMDRDMTAASMNGNVDHDFVTMMLPHHQGAIDMAKAELSFGKDPVIRRLAQEILIEQHAEIEAMNLWLSENTAGTTKKEK